MGGISLEQYSKIQRLQTYHPFCGRLYVFFMTLRPTQELTDLSLNKLLGYLCLTFQFCGFQCTRIITDDNTMYVTILRYFVWTFFILFYVKSRPSVDALNTFSTEDPGPVAEKGIYFDLSNVDSGCVWFCRVAGVDISLCEVTETYSQTRDLSDTLFQVIPEIGTTLGPKSFSVTAGHQVRPETKIVTIIKLCRHQ